MICSVMCGSRSETAYFGMIDILLDLARMSGLVQKTTSRFPCQDYFQTHLDNMTNPLYVLKSLKSECSCQKYGLHCTCMRDSIVVVCREMVALHFG